MKCSRELKKKRMKDFCFLKFSYCKIAASTTGTIEMYHSPKQKLCLWSKMR